MPKRKFFEKQILTIAKDIEKLNKRLKQFQDKIDKQITKKSNKLTKLKAKQEIYNKLDFLIEFLNQYFCDIDGITDLCIEYLIQMRWCDSHDIYYHSDDCFECQWKCKEVGFDFTTLPKIEINKNPIRICAMDIQDHLNILMLCETIDKNHKDGFINVDWTDYDDSENFAEGSLNIEIDHDECFPNCHEFDEEYEYGDGGCQCSYERNERVSQENCPYLCKQNIKIDLWYS